MQEHWCPHMLRYVDQRQCAAVLLNQTQRAQSHIRASKHQIYLLLQCVSSVHLMCCCCASASPPICCLSFSDCFAACRSTAYRLAPGTMHCGTLDKKCYLCPPAQTATHTQPTMMAPLLSTQTCVLLAVAGRAHTTAAPEWRPEAVWRCCFRAVPRRVPGGSTGHQLSPRYLPLPAVLTAAQLTQV